MERPIFWIVGFLFLKIRYRNNSAIATVLDKHYGGDYAAAGTVYFLNAFAGAGFLAMVFGLLFVIYISIERALE